MDKIKWEELKKGDFLVGSNRFIGYSEGGTSIDAEVIGRFDDIIFYKNSGYDGGVAFNTIEGLKSEGSKPYRD